MRYITILLIAITINSCAAFTWAATCQNCYEEIPEGGIYCKECKLNIYEESSERGVPELPANCKYCYEKVPAGELYCGECEIRFSGVVSNIKPNENQLVRKLNDSRERYRRSLIHLIHYYMDIGDYFRLKNARKELKMLNKVPQYKYVINKINVENLDPTKSLEQANTLFHDGLVNKNSINIFNKKSRLLYAVEKFEEIIREYPESDKVDDAAFELANIFEGYYFKDYEAAVYYYVKCYESNPDTDKPARYLAGRIYDIYLKDYVAATHNYELALEKCVVQEYRKIAETRIKEFKEQGY